MDKTSRLYHWKGIESFDFFKRREATSSYELIDIEDLVKDKLPMPNISNIPVLVPNNPRKTREVGVRKICITLFKRFSESEVYGNSSDDKGELDYQEKKPKEEGEDLKKFLEREDQKKENFGGVVGGQKKMFITSDGAGEEVDKSDVVINPIDIGSLLMKKPKKKLGGGLMM
jgi:hypothetical protein